MRNDALRVVIEREHELRKQRAQQRKYVAQGATADEQSTGNTVFNCGNCGAPVVDSRQGRYGHAQRKPECAAAMETTCQDAK